MTTEHGAYFFAGDIWAGNIGLISPNHQNEKGSSSNLVVNSLEEAEIEDLGKSLNFLI